MREIVLDTETTGLDPLRGDRLVEVGCVEIFNRMPTGQTFHVYINPERDMPKEAFDVHGLSSEFLADKPLFTGVVDSFLEFIGDAPLVIMMAGVNGVFGFLGRAWRMIVADQAEQMQLNPAVQDVPSTDEQNRTLHKTIAAVTKD